jgi:hypothetical protein
VTTPSKGATPTKKATKAAALEPDSSFYQFFLLCQRLEREPGYKAKTKIIKDYIERGSTGGTCVMLGGRGGRREEEVVGMVGGLGGQVTRRTL